MVILITWTLVLLDSAPQDSCPSVAKPSLSLFPFDYQHFCHVIFRLFQNKNNLYNFIKQDVLALKFFFPPSPFPKCSKVAKAGEEGFTLTHSVTIKLKNHTLLRGCQLIRFKNIVFISPRLYNQTTNRRKVNIMCAKYRMSHETEQTFTTILVSQSELSIEGAVDPF